MSDKKRESLASKIDEVARNQIWREQLKTEYDMESALTPFQLNPKTLSSITRKPTQTHPADFGKSQDDDETRKLAAKLREVAKKPTEKHALPMTEAQRVGWLFLAPSSCDVTKFADTYCTMAGCSPFADKSTR